MKISSKTFLWQAFGLMKRFLENHTCWLHREKERSVHPHDDGNHRFQASPHRRFSTGKNSSSEIPLWKNPWYFWEATSSLPTCLWKWVSIVHSWDITSLEATKSRFLVSKHSWREKRMKDDMMDISITIGMKVKWHEHRNEREAKWNQHGT